MIYVPAEPYVIKTGKHAGECLETMMMRQYGLLRWWQRLLDRKSEGSQRNEFHRHLKWLLARGENRQPKMICPHCGRKPVVLFTVYHGDQGEMFFDPEHSYCEDCFRSKYSPLTITEEEFRFSFFAKRLSFWERSRAVKLYKRAFGFSGKFTRRKAFEFFVANNKT